ncbi:hypothetical protein FH609_004070 [Streptomyces sp. 3MP-14]|uniref:Uncharacterized protein n=1 Tax=Streptomyces mimosae TaxID=2586635 RepID=A0A5N6A2I4_9ACTN|nr:MULTISPECIES: hypothetical protein [Streptomyces]KAB8162911.1 hypothetical protein FH607_019935 [Streptomyces mimosae]KAB8179124.1 hypothetical protein FH609_004070 [Streptomyces sp. 3MP-14]
MALRFMGIDPKTDGDECPTAWVDEEKAEIVVQGWKADGATEAECLETGKIPETEAVIRLPARMVPILRKACDAAEAAELQRAAG